jgi:hypothetical protein
VLTAATHLTRMGKNTGSLRSLASGTQPDNPAIGQWLRHLPSKSRENWKSHTSRHRRTATDRDRFQQLADVWRHETACLSSTSEMCTHAAYQQIIGMGWIAVPLIIEELRKAPDHWFWALRAITGENPVPPKDRGDLPAMAKRWLDWAEQRLGMQKCLPKCFGSFPTYPLTTTKSPAIDQRYITALRGRPAKFLAGGGPILILSGQKKSIVTKP